MEFLLLAAMAGLVVFALLAATGYLTSLLVLKGNIRRARALLGPAGPEDYEESAILARGGSGFGVLRLTPTELLFGNAALGDVLRLPLARLILVTMATELDADESASPLLIVSAGPDNPREEKAFAVSHPQDWIHRLGGPRGDRAQGRAEQAPPELGTAPEQVSPRPTPAAQPEPRPPAQ